MPEPVEHEDVHDDDEDERDGVSAHEERHLEDGVGEAVLLRREATPHAAAVAHLLRRVGGPGGVAAVLDLQVVREPDGDDGGGDEHPEDEGGPEGVGHRAVGQGGDREDDGQEAVEAHQDEGVDGHVRGHVDQVLHGLTG